MPEQTVEQVRELLMKRIREQAVWLALEGVLTADIELRRQLEQNFTRAGVIKESVRVEGERERVQDTAAEVWNELDSLVDLLIRAVRNEQ